MAMAMARNFQNSRRRGFGKAPPVVAHAEDSQPNESIDKRRRIPSLVVPHKSIHPTGWPSRGNNRGRSRGGNSTTHSNGRNVSLPSSSASGPTNPSGPTLVPNDRPIPVPNYAPKAVSKDLLNIQSPTDEPPAIKTEELAPRLPSPAPNTRDPSPPPIHRVKLEPRTPSPPPPDPPRRAVTSGSKRYFPVPRDCMRANPEFSTNRRKWAHREGAVLRDLGLHIDKFFFRDDGMVIEWTSAEPVWFDTLRPVRARPRAPPPITQEIIDVDADSPDAPPEPVAPPPRAPSPAVSVISVPSSPIADVAVTAQEAQLTSEEEHDSLERLSLDFIKQYILTFDSDRDALAGAYAEDAIFSFRDNNFACPTHFTFQRAARLGQSKSTMPRLPALQNYHFYPNSGTIDLDYDVVVLEPQRDAPTKVMLSANSQLVGADQRTLGIDQCFVLQRDERAAKGKDAWPLVAISHQMVVRETPWVHWNGTLDTL
ncbi:hypothetical protein DFH07DRAFT_1062373 [Mycena maculata]|uniref:NTF2 domain-containing protein n=1 Tax=Mycena maculata TaxID=230809 RepID=A0AAD7IS09_9AGAR|nr:hypothetical protein DFH07DRAFT_1062373 [Mycena maculata]